MNCKPALYTLTGLLMGGATTALVLSLVLQPFDLGSQAYADPAPVSPSPQTVPDRGNWMGDADQHFIVMMIPHHEGAIAMADLALERAQHEEIRTLAQSIKDSQSHEIEEMQTWYQQWYGTGVPAWGPGSGWGWYNRNQTQQGNNQQPIWGPGMGRYQNWDDWNQHWGHGMMGGGMMGSGMMQGGMMQGGMMGGGMMGSGMMGTDLYALKNASDFDREFIQQMIPHHQMGVMMAQMVLVNSDRPEIRELAQSIIDTQTAEINQMQQWYQDWYQ